MIPSSLRGCFGRLELCLQIQTLDMIHACTGGSLQKLLSLVFPRTYTVYVLEQVAVGVETRVPTFASKLREQDMLQKHDGKTRPET